jgi:hypothetical protein
MLSDATSREADWEEMFTSACEQIDALVKSENDAVLELARKQYDLDRARFELDRTRYELALKKHELDQKIYLQTRWNDDED